MWWPMYLLRWPHFLSYSVLKVGFLKLAHLTWPQILCCTGWPYGRIGESAISDVASSWEHVPEFVPKFAAWSTPISSIDAVDYLFAMKWCVLQVRRCSNRTSRIHWRGSFNLGSNMQVCFWMSIRKLLVYSRPYIFLVWCLVLCWNSSCMSCSLLKIILYVLFFVEIHFVYAVCVWLSHVWFFGKWQNSKLPWKRAENAETN
jgi:hypothetical protein